MKVTFWLVVLAALLGGGPILIQEMPILSALYDFPAAASAEVLDFDRQLPHFKPSGRDSSFSTISSDEPIIKATVFDQFPLDFSIFGRDINNTCRVTISGSVLSEDFDAIRVRITRDREAWQEVSHLLSDVSLITPFDLVFTMTAGLFDYDLEIVLEQDGVTTVVSTAADLACGDVFLVNGQSNAVANDRYEENQANRAQSHWVRSFGSSVSDPSTISDQSWDIADGHGSNQHAQIGQWAMHLAGKIVESQRVPVGILNGAVGGTSIALHQRNDTDPTNASTIYGRLLWRAREAGLADQVRAIIWHQGEADAGRAEFYIDEFSSLREDWREDYPRLDGIYLFQVRFGCRGLTPNREQQRQLANLFEDVTIMSTTAVPGHDGCHFFWEGYKTFAERLYPLLDRDLYQGQDAPEIEAPNIVSANWSAPNEITLTFHDGNLSFDTGAEVDFVLSDGTAVTSGTALGNQVILQLAGPSDAVAIDYQGHPQDGAWVTNSKGIGILAFFNFLIN